MQITSNNLGNTSETQGLSNIEVPLQAPQVPNQTAPNKTGGGCGCCGCLTGCLTLLLICAAAIIGIYYAAFHNGRYLGQLDTVIVWTYKNQARPKIIEMFGANMSPAEKEQFIQMSDSALEKYLKLPPEEKQAVLEEGSTALYYLWTEQILPPEKIPHLKKFIEELQEGQVAPPQRDWETTPPSRQRPRQNQRLMN